jgi:hypothetical protein
MKTIFIILITFSFIIPSFSQNNNSDFLQQKITLDIKKGTFVYVLAKLCGDYGIRIGWEKSSNHKDEFKININVEEKSLSEVLDILISQEPQYKWELKGKVLNFSPAQNRDKFLSKFLNLRISRIEYPKYNDDASFKDNILKLPEVRKLMKSEGRKYAEYWNEPSISLFSTKRKGVFLSNVSMTEILNALIEESEHTNWVLENFGNKQEMFLLSF